MKKNVPFAKDKCVEKITGLWVPTEDICKIQADGGEITKECNKENVYRLTADDEYPGILTGETIALEPDGKVKNSRELIGHYDKNCNVRAVVRLKLCYLCSLFVSQI